MNTELALSTAAGAGSASLSILVIANWILGFRGISVPPDVQQAAGTILTIAIHWFFTLKRCAKNTDADTSAQNQENKNV